MCIRDRHSHGGRISIILASKYNIVKKLILIDSAGLIPKRKVSYYVKVYWFKLLKKMYLMLPAKNKQAKLAEFYKKFGSKDYREAEGVMRQTMVKAVSYTHLDVYKRQNQPDPAWECAQEHRKRQLLQRAGHVLSLIHICQERLCG